MKEVLTPTARPALHIEHVPVEHFKRNQPLMIQASIKGKVIAVELRYRRVDQAETWRPAEMKLASGKWSVGVPADYTDSAFPIQYYFVVRNVKDPAALHPGLGANLMSQPYFVARQA
jgi:hypothetical protein